MKELRKQKGLTLVALATLTWLNKDTLSRIENWREPTATSLKKISEALKIETTVLYNSIKKI